jgi:hypothetical protein
MLSLELLIGSVGKATIGSLLLLTAAPADLKQTRQLAEILKKAKRNSVLIGTSPISRYGATLAYFSIFLSALNIHFPNPFSTRRLSTRPNPWLWGLSSLGAVTTVIPRTRYCTPPRPSPVGALYIGTLQGEGQIQQFLKLWQTDTMISRMLQIDLAWSRWQSGLSRPILNDTATPLPHLECRWLHSLQNFLQYTNDQLHVNQPFVQPIERIGGFHIMDYAIQSGRFDEEALRIINYCRLYLHATTVSELFNTDGTSMLPDMFACRRAPWMDPTTIVTLSKRSQVIIKFDTIGIAFAVSGARMMLPLRRISNFTNGYNLVSSYACADPHTWNPAPCLSSIIGKKIVVGNIFCIIELQRNSDRIVQQHGYQRIPLYRPT